MHVSVSVTDEGQGIAPERLAGLFRKFGEAAEPGVEGGLGLSICKGLVEAHGGRIYAENIDPGQGARITFTLPLARVISKDLEIDRDKLSMTTAESSRILVVDDDPQILRFVRGALLGAGYDPIVAADAHDLPRILRTEHIALVVLDFVLPGTDGIELMETIPELSDLPVIFISGYGRDENVVRALRAGADDYIVKPFSPTELTARVAAALRRRAGPEKFVLKDLVINYTHRKVDIGSNSLDLTATEYELLRVLSLESGRVVTYEALLRRVWTGRDYANNKVVRAFIKRLRNKMGEDSQSPDYIVTVRGVGYRMIRPDEA